MFSWDTAKVCVELSRRAYDEGETVGNARALRTSRGGVSYWAFAGTNDVSDMLSDARYVKTHWPMGGRVHMGFKEEFDRLVPLLETWKKDDGEFPGGRIMCGHSLGGALAQLAASFYGADAIYTFGCPRVGNADFVKEIRGDLHRFENKCDLVTYSPPRQSARQALHALLEGRMPTLYKHGGEEISLPTWRHSLDSYIKGIDEAAKVTA